jgi:hypothetical protein
MAVTPVVPTGRLVNVLLAPDMVLFVSVSVELIVGTFTPSKVNLSDALAVKAKLAAFAAFRQTIVSALPSRITPVVAMLPAKLEV